MAYTESKDWVTAFDKAIPKRKVASTKGTDSPTGKPADLSPSQAEASSSDSKCSVSGHQSGQSSSGQQPQGANTDQTVTDRQTPGTNTLTDQQTSDAGDSSLVVAPT